MRMEIRSGIAGFISGAVSVLWGLRRISSDRDLRRLTVLPMLLTSVFYAALLFSAVAFADDVLGWIWARPDSGILSWLWYVLVPFVVLALLVPFALLFSTVAEAIGGPFYDRLAIRTLREHHISTKEPGLLRGTVPDIVRSMTFALAGAACALLALIPVVGIPFTALGALIACIGFASSAINSALMVSGLGLRERLSFVFRSFSTMAGIGAVISVSLLVPFLGLLSLPSAVVGASELYARSRR